MKCENCEKENDGSYSSGRFCSMKCARGFSTKNNKKERNKKISKKLKGTTQSKELKKIRSDIQIERMSTGENKKILSDSLKSYFKNNPEVRKEYSERAKKRIFSKKTRKKLSKISSDRAKKRHANGDISFMWPSRKNLKPSYPESVFIKLLDEEKIKYEREVKIGKWFADFLINKTVLEIDGSQHEKKERKESDKIKDEFLKINGYGVYRIKWNPKNAKDKFIEFIKQLK